MKNIIIAVLLLATGVLSYNAYTTRATLETHTELLRAYSKAFAQTDQNFEGAYAFMKEREELAISREHSIVDSLEERIGTLERSVGDLQFIFGKKKH